MNREEFLFSMAVRDVPHVSLRLINSEEVYCVTNVRVSERGNMLEVTAQVWNLPTSRLVAEQILVSPLICRFMPMSGDDRLAPDVRMRCAELYERFRSILMEGV